MSTLTQQERDGLEDVFLSIHNNKNKYYKIGGFTSIITDTNISSIATKLLKQAKVGLKKRKRLYFFYFFNKKKKSLSK
ncbi:hypothetical protein [Sulfurimonas denitrificans]|uniref:hypothetical protein n=1 Tax=Sulfurimonas denitrificans TaxID=39766 RepID=UPI0002FEE97E|nr:hypothetical protein [Sulfurimonas denitrificans]